MALQYATEAAVALRLGITLDDDSESAESGDEDDSDEQLLATIVAQVNDYMETPHALGCAVGPSPLTEMTLDGRDARNGGRMLFVRIGINELASVTVNGRTISDWALRPLEQDRTPGWPAQQLWRKSDVWPNGWGDVVLYGSDESDVVSFGFPEMQPALAEIAEVTAVRAFLGKRAGEQDMVGPSQQGQPMISRYVSERDRDTLRAFREKLALDRGFISAWMS